MSERNANIPSNFDRLAQGSAARDAMIARVMSMASTPVDAQVTVAVTDPGQFSSRRARRASVFATGALGALSIGAAALAACGGESKANSTDKPTENPVATQPSNPGVDVIPGSIVPTAEAASPVVEPTVAVEVELSQEEIVKVSEDVKRMIVDAISQSGITDEQLTSRHLALSYGDPNSISSSINVCTSTQIGESFVDYDTGRTVTSADSDYGLMFLNNCTMPAMATKALFEITGDQRFADANEAWLPIHRGKVGEIRTVEPRAGEDYWNGIVKRAYIQPSK